MAVTITQDELITALAGDAMRIGTLFAEAYAAASVAGRRTFPVVAALVDRYAPDAPDAISNEAAIRVAGYLAYQPPDARQSEQYSVLGVQFSIRHNPRQLSALRDSGAMALAIAVSKT